MAVGKTLGQVLTVTAANIGVSQLPSLNQDARESLKTFIVDEQERCIDEYDWDEFKYNNVDGSKWWDIALVAGQRYYDWPSNFDWTSVTRVVTQLGGTWIEVGRGIADREYSTFNSDTNVRSNPALRWDTHGAEQFEIWPMPSAAGTVRLAGQQLITAPVAESAVMVFDHIALAKFAAAAYLRSKPDETGETRKLADIRYAEGYKRVKTLRGKRGRMNGKTSINFAKNGPPPDPRDPRYRILIAS